MAQTMTPSQESKAITQGQIDKAVASYRALLEKHAPELDSQSVQTVLGQPELANEQLAVFRRRVEAISEMIVREVEADYDIPPEEAIHATKRVEYLNGEVVNTMPRKGKGKKRVKVCFFPLQRSTSAEDFQKALEERGLIPDPYAVSKVNQDEPSFGDSHPNATQWVDEKGRHCCLAFDRWRGERYVYCDRSESDWNARWWLGGARKQSSGT